MPIKVSVKIKKDTRAWNRMARNLSRSKSNIVDIGWWADRHPTGVPTAQVAKWNEEGHITGTGGISPPRPFIRIGFMGKVKSQGLSRYYKHIDAIALGKMTWTQLNKIMAKDLEESLKREILDWKTPPNSPFTISQKGFDDPLIWTGHMYDSIKTRKGRKV